MDKIKLKAIMTEDSKLYVLDQDGREFEFIPDAMRSVSDEAVSLRIEIEYPHWPLDKPYVEVTFRVPIEVKSKALLREFSEYWRDRPL